MCLAVPGKVLDLDGSEPLMKTGRVAFGPVVKVVNFVYLPEAVPGDYVLVHVGFAMNIIDRSAAENTVRRILSLTSDLPCAMEATPDTLRGSIVWSEI
jgi:hydrogenase expression/formation protein HypC